MKIDGNKKEKAALAAYDQGDRVLAARLEGLLQLYQFL